METRLYVGNLAYSTTEEELQSMFGQAGAVTSVAVIKDRETGRSKGFAFVEMASEADAQQAIDMLNGKKVGGRDLRVSIARPREEGGGGGGRGGFGGRGGNRSSNRRDY
jgi:RNA recognition motif-containing protein